MFARIEFVDENGNVDVLKQDFPIQEGEIIDCATMNMSELKSFLESQIQDSNDKGDFIFVHMKATMMKVSDPIIFGAAVEVFFKDVFDKHGQLFEEIGVDSKNGLGDVYAKA